MGVPGSVRVGNFSVHPDAVFILYFQITGMVLWIL